MTEVDALALAKRLAVEIPERAQKYTAGAWTQAVYESLKTFASEQSWNIIPPERCFKDEYHCDFMLFEKDYGCRLACESQWQTSSNVIEIKWAFNKLRGVKSDVKLFIFEANGHWEDDIREYLENYAQLDPIETFVFMRWHHKQWSLSWWKPKKAGVQDEAFKTIPL